MTSRKITGYYVHKGRAWPELKPASLGFFLNEVDQKPKVCFVRYGHGVLNRIGEAIGLDAHPGSRD